MKKVFTKVVLVVAAIASLLLAGGAGWTWQ